MLFLYSENCRMYSLDTTLCNSKSYKINAIKKYGLTALHRISFLRKNEQRHIKKFLHVFLNIRYIDYHLTKLFPNVNPAPKDENSSKSSLLNL